MHIQHLAVMFNGWCRMLLGVERLLEDCKGGTPLCEVHIRIHDGDVDEGTVCCVCWTLSVIVGGLLRTVKTKVNARILEPDLVA
jgi:hypothetical protein